MGTTVIFFALYEWIGSDGLRQGKSHRLEAVTIENRAYHVESVICYFLDWVDVQQKDVEKANDARAVLIDCKIIGKDF
jgi:hypothetical protein